jgi:CubicO group peptidase (beta-lactamase class C family)
MGGWADAIDRLAIGTRFSGVVRVDRGGDTELLKAYGLAHRGLRLANAIDTQFCIASGTKGLTALTVITLIEEGRLELTTTARSLLAEDLPLIADDVTVEHLLAHRSGIGDYVDEEAGGAATDYVLSVAVHQLTTTEQYVPVLAEQPSKFPAGERFSYCNSGYVVLALIAERVTGTSFHDLVEQRVCVPADMRDTAFLRSDEPTGRAALGYLTADGLRTNVLHLPVKGSGDGGIYSTVADIHALWDAMFAGRVVASRWIGQIVRPRGETPPRSSTAYGLGFWLDLSREAVALVGSDAGVSFRSVRDPASHVTYTVMSNTTDGAWPIARRLDEVLTR